MTYTPPGWENGPPAELTMGLPTSEFTRTCDQPYPVMVEPEWYTRHEVTREAFRCARGGWYVRAVMRGVGGAVVGTLGVAGPFESEGIAWAQAD